MLFYLEEESWDMMQPWRLIYSLTNTSWAEALFPFYTSLIYDVNILFILTVSKIRYVIKYKSFGRYYNFDVCRDCQVELSQQTLKPGQGCKEFKRPSDHHHQQTACSCMSCFTQPHPLPLKKKKKASRTGEHTFSIRSIHH